MRNRLRNNPARHRALLSAVIIGFAGLQPEVAIADCGSGNADRPTRDALTQHMAVGHPIPHISRAGEPADEETRSNAVQDILGVAASNAEFGILVAAVKTAGLDDAFSGVGPFTVFAPTNEAFATMSRQEIAALLGNKRRLFELITSHMVAGVMDAEEIPRLDTAQSVLGQRLRVETANGTTVGGARLVRTDLIATNGLIHAVDRIVQTDE